MKTNLQSDAPMTQEDRSPFKASEDLFYSESNISTIRASMEQAKQGKLHTFTWEEFEAMARKAEAE